MAHREITLKEWYEVGLAKLGLKNSSVLEKSKFAWKNYGPYSLVTVGRPKFYGPILLNIALAAVWILVQVYNQYLWGVLTNYPAELANIDFVLVENLNVAANWAGVFASFLFCLIIMYMHLNTWGEFELQLEPCVVHDIDGDVLTTVIRIYEANEIWPIGRGTTLETFLEQLEEEEAIKYVKTEINKIKEPDPEAGDGDRETVKAE